MKKFIISALATSAIVTVAQTVLINNSALTVQNVRVMLNPVNSSLWSTQIVGQDEVLSIYHAVSCSNTHAFYCEPGSTRSIKFVQGTNYNTVDTPTPRPSIPQGVEYNGTNVYLAGFSSGVSEVRVGRYLVTNNPPSTMSFLDTNHFGGTDTVFDGIKRFPSGAIAVTMHEATTVEGPPTFYPMITTTAYRDTAGSWSTYTNTITSIGGSITSVKSTMCLHPADGSMWWIGHRDSYGSMFALRMIESGGGLAFTTYTNFIAQSIDGANGPDGENPESFAFQDTVANKIKLIYQKNERHVFSVSPFIVGAYLGIAAVETNGTCTFERWQTNYVERASPYGTLVNNSTNIYIGARIVDASWTNAAPQFKPAHYSISMDSGATFGSLISFGQAQPPFAVSVDAPAFLYRDNTVIPGATHGGGYTILVRPP